MTEREEFERWSSGFGYPIPVDFYWKIWQAAYAAGVAAERERAAKAAEAEEELEGDPPKAIELLLRGKYQSRLDVLRATVRATKASIAAAIRRGE